MSTEDFRVALDRRDERMAAQLDRIVERMENRFDRMEAKFDLRQDEADKDVQREFGETRRDLGELRDLIHNQGRRIDDMEEHRDSQMSASAEGAARGAGQAAGLVAAATAKITAAEIGKGFWATWTGKITMGCAAFTSIVVAISSVPGVVRGWNAFWAFVAASK